MISLVSAVNNLQTGIVHPDVIYFINMQIIAERKDDVDLINKNNIKSLTTTKFQLKLFDTVKGYRFVLMATLKVKPAVLE